MKERRRNLEKNASGYIVLIPEVPEDMWHAYNLIRPSDRLTASAVRKVTTESKTGTTKSERVVTKLTITVTKIDFDPAASSLHIAGRVSAENRHVPLGAHHTLDLELHREFILHKDEWDTVTLGVVKEAVEVGKDAAIAAVVLQEGLANLCFITEHMTVVKQRLEVPVPKKRANGADGHEKGLAKFYTAVAAAMAHWFDYSALKAILLASPGFTADALKTHIFTAAAVDNNKALLAARPKFVVVHCSSGHVHSLNQVLQSQAVRAKLSDTRFARESAAVDGFYRMLTTDEDRAWYGAKEVKKAVELGAVGTLLVSDELFRSNSVEERRRYVKMVDDVRAAGGEALVCSSVHESGVRLGGLGGVAAVLTYPVAELDEEEEEGEREAEKGPEDVGFKLGS
ncbi:eRF1 domain 1-domain-containing protein [Geopyxis carbonaria]|nr:eRF1 domain 1-domain-containing protein [Geopyxis carbonaria]